MASSTSYEVAVPAGLPQPVFVGLYAEAVRKRLEPVLPTGSFQVRLKQVNKEKYEVVAVQGVLNGVRVEVGMKKSILHQELKAVVAVKAYSKVEQVLQIIVGILLLLCGIPIFFLMVALIRFLILSFLATVILLVPFAALFQVILLGVMAVLYRMAGNEFDVARRSAIAEHLKPTPVPDFAQVLRAVSVPTPPPASPSSKA